MPLDISYQSKIGRKSAFLPNFAFMRILFPILLLFPLLCNAQRMQLLKGKIVDIESKAPLSGARVVVTDVSPILEAETDIEGNFIIKDVPIGKHTIFVSYIGYQSKILTDVLVTSAKEVILPVEMEEHVQKMGEVIVTGEREHINEMAIISTKTFDVQETERYAGSRADPARMASNFAGAQGGDDSRNDIIIRGNSPQGVLWRLEGIDIPNPNHFAIPGTTGGPVSMLNSKTLANSEFFTGAFPAEYGNAVGGVFDLKLRNGNSDRHELTGQFGFLGTEISAEGPISKKSGSSFLFAYRYSTLKIFNSLNIQIGTTSIPSYQDATFKLNFPIGKKSSLAIFGIGGLSKIDLIVSTLTEATPQLYGQSDRDQYFSSNAGLAGVSFNHTLSENTYAKLTIAQAASDIWSLNEKVYRNSKFEVDSLKKILSYNFITTTIVAHWYVNKKISARHTLKAGIVNNHYRLNFQDSTREYPATRPDWQIRENYRGSTDLFQAYVQYKYRPSDAVTLVGGLHGQYLSLNGATALEPRLNASWKVNDNNVLAAGYGIHSQMQQLYQYYAYQPGTRNRANENIGFTRSHHIVLGYYRKLASDLKVHLESYYQYLFKVPIEIRSRSSYSALNQGSTFLRDFPHALVNKGTGYNYGIELTFEKKFNRGFYMLFTGSVFDSKAKGNDDVYRNTDYNSRYAVNLLAGYERKLSKSSMFFTGMKITHLGGKPYSPADITASNSYGDLVIIDSLRNTLRFEPYFRADVKLGIRVNARKMTHEIALDLINITGTKNMLSTVYSSDLAAQGATNPFYNQYQLGFLPIFYYRIDFGFGTERSK